MNEFIQDLTRLLIQSNLPPHLLAEDIYNRLTVDEIDVMGIAEPNGEQQAWNTKGFEIAEEINRKKPFRLKLHA